MADLGGQKAKKRGGKRKLSAIYSVICQLFINFVRIFHPAMRCVAPPDGPPRIRKAGGQGAESGRAGERKRKEIINVIKYF